MNGYIALYRKWRPKSFADVVGQEHITKVLSAEILSGNVSHAYLFCGSRGTGKTTCAKIFAGAVNCMDTQDGNPCGKCEACKLAETSFDIVEMDAASNNGVDEIRKLREEVMYPPSELKKKVYIIDEVHMLSQSAFNALLKTLEEPPEHVIFILATTELNKIPVTILSRCKRFDFHRITPDKIFERIKFIAETEKININDEALRLISRLATGAMRDALSALEMFVGRTDEKIIDEKIAAETLGVMGKEAVLETVAAIAEKNIKKALKIVDKIYDSGKDLSVLCSECGEIFRDMLMIKYMSEKESANFLKESAASAKEISRYAAMFTPDRLIFCTEVLEETMQRLTAGAFSRRTVFETALFKLCGIAISNLPETVSSKVSALEERLSLIENALKNMDYAQRISSATSATEKKSVDNFSTSKNDIVENSDMANKSGFETAYGFSESDIPPDLPQESFETSSEDYIYAESHANTPSLQGKDNVKKQYDPYDDVPFDVKKPIENEKVTAEKFGIDSVDMPVENSVDTVENQALNVNFGEKNTLNKEKSNGSSDKSISEKRKPVIKFNEIAEVLREKDKMYISFLNNAKAFYNGSNDSVTIELTGFAFNFISASENKKKEISEAVEKVLGKRCDVRIVKASDGASSSPWSL